MMIIANKIAVHVKRKDSLSPIHHGADDGVQLLRRFNFYQFRIAAISRKQPISGQNAQTKLQFHFYDVFFSFFSSSFVRSAVPHHGQ